MKILVLADVESKYLWDYFEKEKLDGIDLILSCGDLRAEYLSFLASFSKVPILYVRGNHDDNYAFKELELYMETDRNILGQKGTKKIIIKPKDLDENYMVRKTLTADKRYQTVRYIARDKAGNVIDSNDNGDTKVCLVTDSKTVKEYQEHKKEYMLIGIISTLGIFIVISGSGLFIFTRRKRNLK